MNDPKCAELLAGLSDDARFAIQKEVLGQWKGKAQQGLCGPLPEDGGSMLPASARLWSQPCHDFCRDSRARKDEMCTYGLEAYCKAHAKNELGDPLCACYYPHETYTAIRKKADAALANTPLAQKISEIIQRQNIPDYCWYLPCRDSDNRPPDSTCPVGDVYACVQVDSENSYTSGGTQEHEKKCFFPGDSHSAPPNGSSGPPPGSPPAAGKGAPPVVGAEDDARRTAPPPPTPTPAPTPTPTPTPPPPVDPTDQGLGAGALAGIVVAVIVAMLVVVFIVKKK
jgi:hypothetical protein